jgi:hypothetical protein
MKDLIIYVYTFYIVFISALTIYVARNLFNHSKEFMITIFKDRTHLAIATNKLFEIAFFLFSFGLGLFWLEEYQSVESYRQVFEMLSEKVGAFTLFIGCLFMFNLFLFFRGLKKRGERDRFVHDKIRESIVE